MAGHLFHGLLGQMQAATTLLDSRSGHIPSPWSCDQTPRVLPVIPVVANVESPATEHHLLRNAHALPLLLPRVPRTASTSLEVTATATLKSPVIRLPTGTAHCPSLWKLPQAIQIYSPYQGDNSLHTVRKETVSIQTKSSPNAK